MRTINSPGVQITEIDLSDTTQTVVGTNVYVMGFASQGPTDEVVSISTISEFEQIFGLPTNAAERYFYQSAKQVVQSAGNLLTTRLPYGSAAGLGFSDSYSALFYPVASSTGGFTIGNPSQYTLSNAEYNQLAQNNFAWSSISSSTTAASWDTVNANAGIIIINDSQTTINDIFEGYYISLKDNTDLGPDTSFTAVTSMYSLVNTGDTLTNWYTLPTSKLAFNLSGSNIGGSNNSVSEIIETTPLFDFGDSYYQDSLILNLFKVRQSIYDPQMLSISLVEIRIGSLDANKKTSTSQGGIPRSFYLSDIVNNSSSNLTLLVNPAISKHTSWTSLSTNNPLSSVSVDGSAKALFAEGVYTPVVSNVNYNDIGNVASKVDRALSLVDNPEIYPLDIVVDAGLTTIAANAVSGIYDDSVYVDITQLSSAFAPCYQSWSSVYGLYDAFTSETRKDCMIIVDPLRQIFINGSDTKIVSIPGNTFSQNVYTPLKTLFGGTNSNYAATYGNWVKVYDANSDKQFWCPFSGFAANIYANSDKATYPWIAPAGLTRGIVKGITDIAFNPNQKQRDFLYTISINPVVFFPNDGYVVYGQKTLQKKPSAFDRVNVRRLFLSLEKSTQDIMKYFVFEPNTDFTRTRVVNALTPIFENAKNTQGVYDYLVVCDSRNNTPDSIDANELHVDIYLKPVRAAEFILINFVATRTSQNFQELVG